MRRFLSVAVVIISTLAVSAQTTDFYTALTDQYRVNSTISEVHAQEIAKMMQAQMELFNSTLHFDISSIDSKLKVTIFTDKTGFDDYLKTILDQTRDDFAYIHYSDLTKSELVGYVKDDEDAFRSSLLHQGFIQLLKAFVPHPPIWMREGIATYLEESTYDKETGVYTYKPNMIWLDTLKGILGGEGEAAPLTLSEVLLIDRDTARDKLADFYPQSWGVVTFLMESEKKSYNRILWEALKSLSNQKTLKENSTIVKNLFAWLDETELVKDYVSFVTSLKTFNDLVSEGITFYAQEDLGKAEVNFSKASSLEPESFISYYYLGLISYSRKDYIKAEAFYSQALAKGADSALTQYALGVNAFADNRFDKAGTYLAAAKTENAADYGDKVDSLLQRIDTLR
jgi:hypothetical protein